MSVTGVEWFAKRMERDESVTTLANYIVMMLREAGLTVLVLHPG